MQLTALLGLVGVGTWLWRGALEEIANLTGWVPVAEVRRELSAEQWLAMPAGNSVLARLDGLHHLPPPELDRLVTLSTSLPAPERPRVLYELAWLGCGAAADALETATAGFTPAQVDAAFPDVDLAAIARDARGPDPVARRMQAFAARQGGTGPARDGGP